MPTENVGEALEDILGELMDLEHDGVTYTLTAPGLSDMSALQRHLRNEPHRDAGDILDALGDSATAAERREYLNEAKRASARLREVFRDPEDDNNKAEFKEVMNTREAMMFIAWRSLRHKHPELTLDKVASMFKNPDTAEQIQTAIGELDTDAPEIDDAGN